MPLTLHLKWQRPRFDVSRLHVPAALKHSAQQEIFSLPLPTASSSLFDLAF